MALLQRVAAFAGVAFELLGDRAHPLNQVVNALKTRLCFIGAAALQQQFGPRQIGLHGGERLVQFMRHGGGHLAQGGQLLGLRQRLLGHL